MFKDQLFKTSGLQFDNWLFGPEKFWGPLRNRPQECVGSLMSHTSDVRQGLCLSSSSEKSRKSHHLADVITKGTLSSWLFKDRECWSGGRLNLRPSVR